MRSDLDGTRFFKRASIRMALHVINENPSAAGHLWRPGFEPWSVSDKLEAFSLTGRGPANVHIYGEAFSDFQGFMEGALRSAHRALTKTRG